MITNTRTFNRVTVVTIATLIAWSMLITAIIL
jgi:hypothetical protein